MRKKGYYFVVHHNMPKIAYWCSNCWLLTGSVNEYFDVHMDCIDEVEIKLDERTVINNQLEYSKINNKK